MTYFGRRALNRDRQFSLRLVYHAGARWPCDELLLTFLTALLRAENKAR
jgi:hypothetical protein